jgi:hypothetical protein
MIKLVKRLQRVCEELLGIVLRQEEIQKECLMVQPINPLWKT